jgi:predicted PurR-regulated permease PerM
MPYLDSKRQRAAVAIIVLGVGLAVALWPFATGLIGAPVLYVVFAPLHRWLARRIPRSVASGVVIVLAILLVLGPGVSIVTLVATQAPGMAETVLQSALTRRIAELRIGPYLVGEQLQQLGARAVQWLGASALGLVGTATRLLVQLTVAVFGLYYMLDAPARTWRGIRPFIPFSAENAERLRQRFKNVTASTLIGTFLTAAVQGTLVGLGFWVAGLANPVFWGVVTVAFSILPVVGSGLIWGPGAASLALDHQWGRAIGLALWGILVIGNIDNLIRPWVFRRYAQIHPFVTIIGAFAGIQYFGLMGLLIGPLAISYFFELIRMYRAEYLDREEPAVVEEELVDRR